MSAVRAEQEGSGGDPADGSSKRSSPRRSTATSNFGVGKREGHDASGFYARFQPPALSSDDVVVRHDPPESCVCGDAREMRGLPDACVALVVTSPPYFAGKAYEEALGEGGIPGSYLEYLGMLRDVFAECVRVLEPGGRIAVNVANLGRKPYRSLSADVIAILQDDLGLLLRGEVIWQKAEGATGSCAWGSYRSPSNPVLRDLTERVVIASKGRFDRAGGNPAKRAKAGLPHLATSTTEEFLASTLDVWHIPPESARRVGHPAPFPVELPERVIHLYTFEDDLVLDPFLGSGTTAIAALRAGRRFVGYDTDPEYVSLARHRVDAAMSAPLVPIQAAAPEDGRAVSAMAEQVLTDAGFEIVDREQRVRGAGVSVPLVVEDRDGVAWYVDVTGAFTVTGGGLRRTDEVWAALGRAHVMMANGRRPYLLLSSHLPTSGPALQALRSVGPKGFFDALAVLDPLTPARLRRYASGGRHKRPEPGFWKPSDLSPEP